MYRRIWPYHLAAISNIRRAVTGFVAALKFNDARNSQYVPLLFM